VVGSLKTEDEEVSIKEKRNLREKTLEMFQHAYKNYMKYAYPADELMPLTCKGRTRGKTPSRGDVDDALGNFQLTLVDALDTLAFLGQIDEFNSAIGKINSTLNLDGDFMISTFETNIRMLGGLLGGHSVAIDLADQGKIKYDNCLLRFAKIIGDKLMPAFNTSTGIPFSRINLKTGWVKKTQPETCTACAGTLILEFAALSRYTKDPIYEEKARKALDTIWHKRHQGTGLVGTVINTSNGDWIRRESGVGAGIDSYYEYLLKAYILLGDEEYLDRFNIHYTSIKRYIKNGPLLIDVQMHKPTEQSRGFMDSLSAFWPGVQVLKGDIQHAIETHELLYQIFQKYGQIPEAFTHRFDIHWGQYPLRPEFAESTYLLYKATEDPYYLKVGRDILNSLEEQTRVECGFAGIKDVRNKSHEDRMDSFFLAEMFKYLFLIFAESDDLIIDPDRYVFTTEAHLLPLDLRKNHTNHGLSGLTKPSNSKLIPDGSESRSCLNPLPNGQTGKLYQKEELETWRQTARNYMIQTGFNKNKSISKSKGTGKAQVNFQNPKLRARDFMLGNKEHEKILTRMGIQIMNKNGNVQLMHVADLATNGQYAEEGLIFMKDMIQLNEEAEKVQQSSDGVTDSDTVRYISIQPDNDSSNDVIQFVAGPAQFGYSFRDGPIVGTIAKVEPYSGCSAATNCDEIYSKIAIMKRGGCMFAEKVKRAESCGAIAAIIVDNQPNTGGDNNAIFSMAGDGQTQVEIGSAFLPSKEAAQLFEKFEANLHVKVGVSYEKKIDFNKLFKNDETMNARRRNKDNKVFTTKDIIENPEIIRSKEENVSDANHDEHDEL
jgi:mannosidase alpha-like ER degradation enhancer 3